MGARSYCHKCGQGLALATMQEACDGEQPCPHCDYTNSANATPAEVFELYKDDVESRLQQLEAEVRRLLQNSNA